LGGRPTSLDVVHEDGQACHHRKKEGKSRKKNPRNPETKNRGASRIVLKVLRPQTDVANQHQIRPNGTDWCGEKMKKEDEGEESARHKVTTTLITKRDALEVPATSRTTEGSHPSQTRKETGSEETRKKVLASIALMVLS